MFVYVKLLQGYTKTLTYKIPLSWGDTDLTGSVITVPLKNKIVPALVVKTYHQLSQKSAFEIKEAVGKDHLPPDHQYAKFIQKVSQFYFVHPKKLYQRTQSFIYTKEQAVPRITANHKTKPAHVESITPTTEQQQVINYLLPLVDKPKYAPTLLHGVTGSGKTEIYKKIIQSCVKNNKTVLLLLPEVSLSLQFENLLAKQLPASIPIFGFHSASKASVKKKLWQSLLTEKACLIVGVHLPVMLPIPNLGYIIVDEEHELGFQEKKHPKINSKEMAIWRAKLYDIPILLGSATPSINSIYNVKKHNWRLFELKKRFAGNFPNVKIVTLDGTRRRSSFWITRELERAIADRIEKKEQTLLFINRRGYSFFVQCKQCGFTFLCPHCSVSLTLHKGPVDTTLCCHYCDHKEKRPTVCRECKAPEKELLQRGIGTQQVVSILEKLFPEARIARADLDTTRKKRLWQETVEKFENQEIDILVGTQTITKGYHFPHVTLVGIIWADLNVHFPVFNASETALQQLVQVAGRAGRQSAESLVIAQVIHTHPIFEFLQEKDYIKFCDEEMGFREETLYPPFGRLVQIELKHTNAKTIDDDARRLSTLLTQLTETKSLGVSVLGPAKPLVYRIQKTEMRHIFLKAPSFTPIYKLLHEANLESFDSQVFVIPT
ncbi:primosomal protein N' [Candidatus Dependentiae bacterium]|nr:primosomal protein N' [Candidatus Dependentiae bacterium]